MTEVVVTLNGEEATIPGPASLAALLEHLGLDPRAVAIEHNREIVRRAQLASTPVAAGDTIEVVHFVGGG
ncbi:MAG TPA: sulfur carrier protein ThiS [Gemmatimonadales bacterium]|nr:sulfur carrier protein ThiS [Gemmatimonadales bacterium]